MIAETNQKIFKILKAILEIILKTLCQYFKEVDYILYSYNFELHEGIKRDCEKFGMGTKEENKTVKEEKYTENWVNDELIIKR